MTSKLWLCSKPRLFDNASFPPEIDSEGDRVSASEKITPEDAAEIAVETSDFELNDGDEMSVWVWQPKKAASAKEYIVNVTAITRFSTK